MLTGYIGAAAKPHRVLKKSILTDLRKSPTPGPSSAHETLLVSERDWGINKNYGVKKCIPEKAVFWDILRSEMFNEVKCFTGYFFYNDDVAKTISR